MVVSSPADDPETGCHLVVILATPGMVAEEVEEAMVTLDHPLPPNQTQRGATLLLLPGPVDSGL